MREQVKKILSGNRSGNYPHGIIAQFLTFAGVGAIGTVAHYLTLIGLVQLAGANPIVSSVIGFINGAFVNYILNYRITFRSSKKHREAMIKFFIVAIVGLVFNTSIMALAYKVLNLHYLISQVLATGMVLFWNFIGNLLWTFKEEGDGNG